MKLSTRKLKPVHLHREKARTVSLAKIRRGLELRFHRQLQKERGPLMPEKWYDNSLEEWKGQQRVPQYSKYHVLNNYINMQCWKLRRNTERAESGLLMFKKDEF